MLSRLTFSISGGAQRRPLHAVVSHETEVRSLFAGQSDFHHAPD